MQQKFNEALVKEVREGRLAVENVNGDKNISALLKYIFPNDQCNPSSNYYYFYSQPCNKERWGSSQYPVVDIPCSSVSDFFLQPPTEKEGKERTYRVTREQLGKIAFDTEEYECYCESFATRIQVYESAREFTEMEVKDIFNFHGSKDFCKQLFPDFNPTPHIPKGEYAWVSDGGKEWLCVLSAGNGKFYSYQIEEEKTYTWKNVRKYEDRPF